jgi:hypothetical protein
MKGVWLRDLDRVGACLAFYADRVRERGMVPLAMLSECGESAGYWGDAAADNGRAHARTISKLRPMAEAASLALIDPYSSFLSKDVSAGTHWRSSGYWSHTGHRLAGKALFASLLPVLEKIINEEHADV